MGSCLRRSKAGGRWPVADGFWISYPVDDRRVENEMLTEVRVTFDKQYLYIGAVCYGTEDYVIKTLKRDAGSNSIHTWAPVPIEFNEYDLGYTGVLSWNAPLQKPVGTWLLH